MGSWQSGESRVSSVTVTTGGTAITGIHKGVHVYPRSLGACVDEAGVIVWVGRFYPQSVLGDKWTDAVLKS